MPDVGAPLLVLFRQRGQVRVVHVVQAHAAEAGAPADDRLAHVGGELLDGPVHGGEQRVAPPGRQLERVQARAGIRDRLVLAVGMPAPPRALHAERLAAFLDVRDDEDLGMTGQVVLQRLHDVQPPEAAREGDLLLGRHAHVAKDEDAVARPRALDLRERRVVERSREVGAEHLGAKLTLHRTDLELHLPYDYAAWISTPASPGSSRAARPSW